MPNHETLNHLLDFVNNCLEFFFVEVHDVSLFKPTQGFTSLYLRKRNARMMDDRTP